MMKRIFYVMLVLVLATSITACTGKDIKTDAGQTDTYSTTTETVQNSNAKTVQHTSENIEGASSISTSKPESSSIGNKNDEEQLLQSASVDLDNDGINEEVEAIQIKTKGKSENDTGELEGILKITSKTGVIKVPFIKKQAGFSNVMTSMEFVDLDRDGAKDIFLIIPENGAAFSLNYFFIYNYKKAESYSFSSDSSLSEFTNGFTFRYKGGGKLVISNDSYNLTAVFDISKDPGFETDDENNKSYESSWVEPMPVEISEDSRIMLSKAADGTYEIKVPLPVFGLATVDMIGEIDLYYEVDSKFKPTLENFVVYDFNDKGKNMIGKWSTK